MTRPRLTPTQKKILQFVAGGGERGRMLVQIVASGGSWPRRPLGRSAVSEERVTLDMLGELMLSMQADLQVVSSTMLRLERSIDRLCDEIHEIRKDLYAPPGGRYVVRPGYDVSEIALKWATRLGVGFHPDTYGGDYEPPLSPEEVDEYEDDMRRLISLCGEDIDPREVCLDAMRRAGLPVDGTEPPQRP